MVDDRSHLASLEYWRTPQERVPQRFYVAFCLLMSSIQDWILGLKERESQNLNWSATCSYYSLVHGGRLLCFLALGDYPKSHATLRDLMDVTPCGQEHRQQVNDGYPFNWLRGFARGSQGQRAQTNPNQQVARERKRAMIMEYLQAIAVPDAGRRLDQFGKVLTSAAELRNDSNYEALLIAHEFRHRKMSGAFDSLSHEMSEAAEASLSLFIDTFNAYLHKDPDLPEDRRSYESFLGEYVLSRLGIAIRSKLGGIQALEARLSNLEARIQGLDTAVPFGDIERQIEMNIFGNKDRLMDGFRSRIEDLRTLIAESNQGVV